MFDIAAKILCNRLKLSTINAKGGKQSNEDNFADPVTFCLSEILLHKQIQFREYVIGEYRLYKHQLPHIPVFEHTLLLGFYRWWIYAFTGMRASFTHLKNECSYVWYSKPPSIFLCSLSYWKMHALTQKYVTSLCNDDMILLDYKAITLCQNKLHWKNCFGFNRFIRCCSFGCQDKKMQ